MKIKLTIALLGLAFAASAQNPSTNMPSTYSPTPLVYTNGYADNATNATPSGPLNATRYDEIGWCITKSLSGSGTATDYFDFKWSLDNTNWNAPVFLTIALTASGTSTVQTNFTMTTGPQGYVRLDRVRFGSNAGSYPTNIQLLYTAKPFRR